MWNHTNYIVGFSKKFVTVKRSKLPITSECAWNLNQNWMKIFSDKKKHPHACEHIGSFYYPDFSCVFFKRKISSTKNFQAIKEEKQEKTHKFFVFVCETQKSCTRIIRNLFFLLICLPLPHLIVGSHSSCEFFFFLLVRPLKTSP